MSTLRHNQFHPAHLRRVSRLPCIVLTDSTFLQIRITAYGESLAQRTMIPIRDEQAYSRASADVAKSEHGLVAAISDLSPEQKRRLTSELNRIETEAKSDLAKASAIKGASLLLSLGAVIYSVVNSPSWLMLGLSAACVFALSSIKSSVEKAYGQAVALNVWVGRAVNFLANKPA